MAIDLFPTRESQSKAEPSAECTLCHCQGEQRNLIRRLMERPCLMEKWVEHLRVIRVWRLMNELCVSSVLNLFLIRAPCLENHPCCGFCHDIAGIYVTSGYPILHRTCLCYLNPRPSPLYLCVLYFVPKSPVPMSRVPKSPLPICLGVLI